MTVVEIRAPSDESSHLDTRIISGFKDYEVHGRGQIPCSGFDCVFSVEGH